MSQQFLEVLEDRQFFAAQPFSLSTKLLSGPFAGPHVIGWWKAQAAAAKASAASATVTAEAIPAATTTTTPTVRPTSLVGDWSGTVKVKIVIFSKKFDFSFVITGQTSTTLTGKVTIKGHTYSGTFTGKINPANGQYSWKLKKDGADIELTGQLSKSGMNAAGDAKASYDGFSAKGSYVIHKATA